MEAAYCKDLAESLAWRSMLTSGVAAIWWHDFTDNFVDTDAGRTARFIYVSCHGFAAALCACVCLLTTSFVRRRWRGLQGYIEPIVTFWVAVLGAMGHLDPNFTCGLVNAYQSEDCVSFEVQSWDTFLVGCLIAAVSHTYLPLRNFWLLAVDIAVVMPVLLRVITWFSVQNLMHVLTFIVIVGFSFRGSRHSETFARHSFQRVLEEKCLRVETEFKLEQVKQSKDDSRSTPTPEDRHEVASGVTSMPQTTYTGKLFQDATTEALPRIRALAVVEQWLMEPEQLQLNDMCVLGSGASGTVVKGTYCRMRVAVKVPARVDNEKVHVDLLNEVRILRKVRHPNIVIMHGACLAPDSQDVLLVLEYVEGVSMEIFIEKTGMSVFKGRVVSDKQEMCGRAEVLEGISNALIYLHSRKPAIIHGDLKPANIRIQLHCGREERVHAKVLDFGLARIKTKHAAGCLGTIRWAAPELLLQTAKAQTQPTLAVDIFSFGRILYYTSTSEKPLVALGPLEISVKVRKGTLPSLEWPEDSVMGRIVQPLAMACMSSTVSERPSIYDVDMFVSALKERMGLERSGDKDMKAGSVSSVDLQRQVQLLQERHEMQLAGALFRPRAAVKTPLAAQSAAGPEADVQDGEECVQILGPVGGPKVLPKEPATERVLRLLEVEARGTSPRPLSSCRSTTASPKLTL